MPIFYRDLANEVKELLDENYFYDQKLVVKTTNSSGLKWFAEGRMSNKGVAGSMSASLMSPLGIALENLRMKTDGRILLEASYHVHDKVKLLVSAEDGRQEPGKPLHSFGKIGMEYEVPAVAVTADVDVVNGPTIRTSVLGRRKALNAGIDLQYNSHLEDKDLAPELVDFNFGLSYKGKDWSAFAKTTELMSSVRGGYLHKVNEKVTAAALFDYRLKTNYQKISIGTSWRFDQNTILKAKIDSNAVLSGVMNQNLSDNISLTLCSEVNLQDLTADSHKFGIGLMFS